MIELERDYDYIQEIVRYCTVKACYEIEHTSYVSKFSV
jgi:hypothetical protein